MQKLVSFLEKSVEWIALGLAGVFLLLCVYWYLLTPPAIAKIGGKPVAPGDIDELTRDTAVEPILKDIKLGPPEAVKPPDVIGPWTKAITTPPKIEFVSVGIDSFGDQTVHRLKDDNQNVDLITAVAVLPKATPVSVQAGLSVAAPLKGQNGQDIPGAAPFDVLWASAAFSISAQDMKTAFEKPLEKKDPVFAKFYRTAYLSIELQRQRAIGHDATGAPVFPNDNSFTVVEIPKVNQLDIQPLPDAKASRDTKNSFAQWADANELNIRQPKFYTTTAGTIYAPAILVGQPAAPGSAALPAPGAAAIPARPAPAPGIPALINPVGPVGNAQQQTGIDPSTLTTDQLVWAHDDNVEPGRTYRYRVVYHMKNPVFALQNIADPKILDQLDIASPPSDWTGPITIPPNVKYWVTALPRNGTAQMDYFKWEAGNWKWQKNMSLSPGDTIPGTDQTIVDIHNTPSPRPKEQYVLLTDSFGEPIRHYPKDDRDDPELKQRQKDASPDVGGAKPAGGGAPATPPKTPAPAPRGDR